MDGRWSDLDDLDRKLRRELLRIHPDQVRRLLLTIEGDTLTIGGEVASEQCRSDAKRLALSFDGVFKVRNAVEVVGWLVPAADNDDLDGFFGYTHPPKRSRPMSRVASAKRGGGRRGSPSRRDQGADATVEVVRHPSVTSSGAIAAGRAVDLEVDLCVEAVASGAPVSLGRFPAEWPSITISVQLFASWASDIEAVEPTIEIRADGSSRPSRYRCMVAADHLRDAPARVQIAFLHGTRVCGSLERDLADDVTTPQTEQGPRTGAGEAEAARTREAEQSATSSFAVTPDAVGPTLSVSIFRNGPGLQTWTWSALAPGGMQSGGASLDLGGDDAAFARGLLVSCPDLADERFRRTMAGVGERLWQAAPPDFRSAYLGWRGVMPVGFPIQFVTDDPHVPWEMMKPDVDGMDHLFLEHPVARWPLTRAATRLQRLPGGAILSFVPDYGPGRALDGARLEGEWMVSALGGRAIPATRAALLDVLDGKLAGPIGTIHFAGHGSLDNGLSDGGIEMQDGTVGTSDVDQSTTRLGFRDHPLVVLNACETGAGARLLAMNTGWGAAIAARGFGGLIAPLWEVQDATAFAMAQSMLPPLLQGRVRLGEAVRDARRTHADASVAAFAYLAHGDVMAVGPLVS